MTIGPFHPTFYRAVAKRSIPAFAVLKAKITGGKTVEN
jgi:hypothetical protein